MKDLVAALLGQALETLAQKNRVDNIKTPVVEQTRDPSHGDWASNAAMVNCKSFAMKPRDLAEALVQNLPESNAIESVSIAGPGFINFFTNPNWLAEQLNNLLNDGKIVASSLAKQTIVVDYSSPNLAKEMHVGHLRSSIIGDAVVRSLEFLGHTVIRQNHVGDWGTQFGMLIAFMEEKKANEQKLEEKTEQETFALADLENFYRASKKRFDESEAFANRARELVVALQSGDAACLKLWQEFKTTSLSHCYEVYKKLDVSLSEKDVCGESFYNDQLQPVLDALQQKQLLREGEQGAKCVFLPTQKANNSDDEPNEQAVIIQKHDGGFLYATSDLAAIRYRCETLKADRIYYFVDQRQALHFKQMFTIARLAGFADKQSLQHMGFGTMNNADGKPFKTRDGGTVKLISLLNEAEQRGAKIVEERSPHLSATEKAEVAKTIGIGSVKYADLSKNRSSDYIFNLDQMLSFEGNTAPYLLYAYTRIASLFRKAEKSINDYQENIILNHEKEQSLAAKLLQFEERVLAVAEKGTPHFLCQYLFELAGEFSSFYEACPILKSTVEIDTATRDSRLMLAKITAITLQTGLGLLGINTLEKM